MSFFYRPPYQRQVFTHCVLHRGVKVQPDWVCRLWCQKNQSLNSGSALTSCVICGHHTIRPWLCFLSYRGEITVVSASCVCCEIKGGNACVIVCSNACVMCSDACVIMCSNACVIVCSNAYVMCSNACVMCSDACVMCSKAYAILCSAHSKD